MHNLSRLYVSGNATFTSGSGNSEGSTSGSGDVYSSLTPEYSTSATNTTPQISTPGPTISNISVQLPGEVFANVTGKSVGLLYSLYLSGSLFPVAPDSREEGFSIGSPVVGAAVSGKDIANLDSPVVITLPITSVEVNE